MYVTQKKWTLKKNKDILMKEDSTCRICGRTYSISKYGKKRVGLQAHHIDGDCYNHELSNIQILCVRCRHKQHSK